jgi:hypothetical protein
VLGGRKWGYFALQRVDRKQKEIINNGRNYKEVADKIAEYLDELEDEERIEYLQGLKYDILKKELLSKYLIKFSSKRKRSYKIYRLYRGTK